MRQVHLAGDKLFVDYTGKAEAFDPLTGEFIKVELFVACVLGAKQLYTCGSNADAASLDFSRRRSCTDIYRRRAVRDRPRSAQNYDRQSVPLRPWRTTTAELGRYYSTTILPARPMSPRDKAKVEVGVQIAERWLLARIRNETFPETLRRSQPPTFRAHRNHQHATDARTRQAASCSSGSTSPRSGLLLSHFKPRAGRVGSISTTTSTSIITSAPSATCVAPTGFGSSNGESSLEIFHLGARVACHVRSYVRGGRDRPSTCRYTHPRSRQNGRRLASSVGRDGSKHARSL